MVGLQVRIALHATSHITARYSPATISVSFAVHTSKTQFCFVFLACLIKDFVFAGLQREE